MDAHWSEAAHRHFKDAGVVQVGYVPDAGLSMLIERCREDNEIDTLAGLAKLQNLMELYIGNNRITKLKQVLQVKDMPKLIILDLSGNALCTASHHRDTARLTAHQPLSERAWACGHSARLRSTRASCLVAPPGWSPTGLVSTNAC